MTLTPLIPFDFDPFDLLINDSDPFDLVSLNGMSYLMGKIAELRFPVMGIQKTDTNGMIFTTG